MKNTEITTKESRLLQHLIQSGDDIDTFREAVLKCVCDYHGIRDSDKYINSEAKLRYVYQPWQRVDDLVVQLYSRKEYDPSKDYKNIQHEITLREPITVVYALDYEVITPVSIVESYMLKNYSISEGIYLGVKEKAKHA